MFSDLRFREFLIAHFIALLEEADSLEAVEQPTSVPRAYGQYGPDGTFTPRQATLMPRPGQVHITVNLGGRRVALGDTPRYTPPPPQMPRGSPVVVLPLPFMPTASLPVIQRGVTFGEGVAPAFAGAYGPFGQQVREADLLPGGPLPPRIVIGAETTELIWEQYFPSPIAVQEVWRSRLYRPEAPLMTQDELGLLSTAIPQPRPYASGYDAFGPYIASWDSWDFWEPEANNGALSLGAGTFTMTLTEETSTNGNNPDQPPYVRPEIVATVEVASEQVVTSKRLYAYRWRTSGKERIELTDPETGETQFVFVDVLHGALNYYALPPSEPSFFLQTWQNDAGVPYWFIEQVYAGVGALSLVEHGGVLGVVAIPTISFVRYEGRYDHPPADWIPPPPDEDGNPTHPYQVDFAWTRGVSSAYRAPGQDVVFPADYVEDPYDFSLATPGGSFVPDPGLEYFEPGVYPTAFEQGGLVPLPLLPGEREKIPFSDGWPDPPTPESRAEVARLNPYIYDLPPSQAVPAPWPFLGRLANPTGPLGVESTWAGLSWTSLEYVCDAFRASETDPETGEESEHLYAVVILREEGEPKVGVSRDQQELGRWSLWDFFPGADPEARLFYPDGSVWDGALLPHYSFCHVQWPFRDVAYLAPFRARLRHKEDRAGKHFGAGVADCPLTLYLDHYANTYDPAPPDDARDFAPLEAALLSVTAIGDLTAEQVAAITAPFGPNEKPRALASLGSFTVTCDLTGVVLPRQFRLRAYVWVKAKTVPSPYAPAGKPFKSSLHRLAPDVTGAEADFVREETDLTAVQLPVTLAGAQQVVRIGLEVRGLKDDSEPLWRGGAGG